MSIRDDIKLCVFDTSKFVGRSASNALDSGLWKESDSNAVQFIKDKIRVKVLQANGAMIQWKSKGKGVSLESIVLKYPELFLESEVDMAKRTLGL